MRVALVVPEDLPVPPERGGSIQIYLHELTKRLQSKADVTVISRPAKHENNVPGVKYIHIGRCHTYREYVGQICHIVHRGHFDAIQIDNRPKYVSLVHKACPHVPIVLNLHSMNFLYPGLISHAQAQQSLRKAAAINTVSMAVRSRLHRRFPSVADKSTCIYAGVNESLFPSRFSPIGAEKRVAFRDTIGVDRTPVLLYTGRLVPRKGIDHLIEAVRLLTKQKQKIQLWIVGGKASGRRTQYEQQLRSRAHGLPIRFCGFVPPTQLADYYLAADVLVCPSIKPEGLPLVILEGACTGLPVVASQHSGIKECVREAETGLLVPEYKSPRALAESISELLLNPIQAQIYGRQAADLVAESFTWERAAAGFSKLYQSLIDGAWSKELAASLRPC